MLPDYDIWCDTVLAVVEEDHPVKQTSAQVEDRITKTGDWENVHSIGIHGFASIEIEFTKVGHDFLCVVSLHSLLEPLDEVLVFASFIEFLDHLLQVSCS